ncbi:MAG: hypothetical protein WDZ94_01220 [Patescibacteria group bacterium]
MKRILLSLTAIAATVTMTIGATQALFSDSETIAENTVSAAVINLDLLGLNSGEINKPLNITDLVPGAHSEWARVRLMNDSNVPVDAYMYLTGVSGAACSMTNIEVATGLKDFTNQASERTQSIYSGPVSGMQGAANRKEVNIAGTGHINGIPANTDHVVQQRAQLDSEAGNNLQGDSCTWNEVFVIESIDPSL